MEARMQMENHLHLVPDR